MNYQDDPNRRVTFVTLSSHDDAGEAADAAKASIEDHGDRWALWMDSGAFQGPAAAGLKARTAAAALMAAARATSASGVFIICVDLAVENEEDGLESVRDCLPGVCDAFERGPTTRRLIVIFANGDTSSVTGKLKAGIGRVQASAAVAQADRSDFARAIQDRAVFADESWTQYIDALTPDEVTRLESSGQHEPALRRLRDAVREVQGLFLGRERAVEMMAVCALARVNMVFLGPPGTAKSLLVRTFSRALGVKSRVHPIAEEQSMMRQARLRKTKSDRRMFEYLLTRYTTPEEIFGGVDINLLVSGGVHGRSTAGMLPQADTAFLDEIFKANSAILNTLLSITNERLFYNMGQAFKVNLAFVVGASNETPAEEELGALFDRFPIRVPCMPVSDGNLGNLLEKAHAFDCGVERGVEEKACLNDLRLLTKIVQFSSFGGTHVFEKGNDDFRLSFLALLQRLRRDYSISDRTPVQIVRLCRAIGLLDGVSRLDKTHLRCWGYVSPKMKGALDLQRMVTSHIGQGGLFDGGL